MYRRVISAGLGNNKRRWTDYLVESYGDRTRRDSKRVVCAVAVGNIRDRVRIHLAVNVYRTVTPGPPLFFFLPVYSQIFKVCTFSIQSLSTAVSRVELS